MGLFSKDTEKKLEKQRNSKNKNNGDIEKLEEKILQEQQEIEEIYNQIGKVYYEWHRSDNDDRLVPLCNVVKESNRIIALCEKQILFLQGIKLCENCNAQLSLDSLFCNKCGVKVNDLNDSSNEARQNIDNSNNTMEMAIIKCRECGSDNTEDTIFCTNCGAKIS
ncbi:zinc ribbon domain-containing protein [Sedimentibacter sp. zth1]|uniref:zinc ribbon domain-containing protein n=1 Tax=Sedimentibacter sp. zth1 TaxID=2816908 RepID=UPI001A90F8FD|nr:zinc ribbon domain-containing protein [Sedimentibacter sp. zth1]QSX05493.1 zinc ribbon domain-containing protein [Sedimentibacter sp. zth1]